MTKNGCVPLGGTEMYYAAFGSGSRTMAVLPGLSDGLATVNGKAWILSLPYRKYLRDYTVYLFSRKKCRKVTRSGIWRMIRSSP